MNDYMLDFYNINKLPDQSLAVIQCGYQESRSGYKSVLRKYNDFSDCSQCTNFLCSRF